MAVKRLTNLRIQYDDGNGALASSYRLFFYAAGSSTKQNTYNSSAGTSANSNPITLNALGESPTEIWLTVGQTYKIGLAIPGTDDPPASFVWTEDNIAGINDATVTLDQWVSGPTPTFVSTTSFTLSGDQTSTFHVGRRVKTTNTAGAVYSIISASVFGAVTTVTIVNDSGSLDSGLSAVSYSLLSATNPAVPNIWVPTGVIFDYVGSTAPAGWLLLSGLTIGNASSGATARANADTVALFTLLWNSMADSEAPVSTGRGASAAADFAANKTITMPDARGRAIFGKDNMGGSTASRITNGNSAITATTLGVSGGDERLFQHQHAAGTLSADSGGAHTHNVDGYDNAGALTRLQVNLTGGAVAVTVATTSNGAHTHTVSGSTANTGGNTTSQNIPPALILNKIIKL